MIFQIRFNIYVPYYLHVFTLTRRVEKMSEHLILYTYKSRKCDIKLMRSRVNVTKYLVIFVNILKIFFSTKPLPYICLSGVRSVH